MNIGSTDLPGRALPNCLNALIVDDEAELRKSVISILQTAIPGFQFKIEEATNGREAFEKYRSGDWDLVLMDVRMPEMSGIEALHAIKAHDPRTFVVLMTAHSNVQDAIAAVKRELTTTSKSQCSRRSSSKS